MANKKQPIPKSNAGFFIYMDLSPFLPSVSSISTSPEQQQQREFALAKQLLDEGVFLHPGEEHGKEPGWFRLVFTQDQDVLLKGLLRRV
jgi:1-aminocyclopropane-1-carboxylate synthase